MLSIGMVGLGKLGLPLAVSMASNDNIRVIGYDINPELMKKRKYEHNESGLRLNPWSNDDTFQKRFDGVNLTFMPLEALMANVSVVFIAVQTPHAPEYEGITRLPKNKADFDYTWLVDACTQVAKYKRPEHTVAVMSTVLPGTMRKYILPIIPDLVYCPAFPAMGTVMNDFLYPEFILLGGNVERTRDTVSNAYGLMGIYAPVIKTFIESAELAKCAYNTMITSRIQTVNAFMEIAHKTPGCNIDEVSTVLKHANKRITAPAYMDGGLSDQGGCHPRDNIAMSWLADKLNLSCNPFNDIMVMREKQTEWLIDLFLRYAGNLTKLLLGRAYKPESNITTGSIPSLIANMLIERDIVCYRYDPCVSIYANRTLVSDLEHGPPCAVLITTKHKIFASYKFSKGTVIVDPFRYMPPQPGVEIIQVGIGKEPDNNYIVYPTKPIA